MNTFTHERVETWTTGWLYLFAAVLPLSIAVSSIAYFPFLSFYVLFGCWAFKGRWRPAWGPIEKTFLLFWSAGLVSALLGRTPIHSLTRLGKDLYFLILVLVVALLRGRTAGGAKLMKIFVAASICAAILGILQYSIGVNQTDCHGGSFIHLPQALAHWPRPLLNILSLVGGRANGTRCHPLTYAECLLFPLAYSLSCLAITKDGSGWKWTFLPWLFLLALLTSLSRGPWLAAGVMVLMLALLEPHPVAFRRLLVAFLPAVLLLTAPVLRNRLMTISQPTYASNAERVAMWKAGWRMLKDHPFWGIGPGNVKRVCPDYQTQEQRMDGPWGHLHNTFVNAAAERGIIGLAAFLGFLGCLFRTLWKGYRQTTRGSADRILLLTGILSGVGFLASGLTETVFNDSTALMLFYFVMGIALAVARSLMQDLQRV